MPNPKRFEEKKKQLDVLCGDEFEIVVPYTAANSLITVKHKKCGKLITYKQADTVLRCGHINCSCTRRARKYTQESFEKKIHDICPDLKVLSNYTVSTEKVKFLYIPDNVEFEAVPQAIYQKEGYPFNVHDNTQIIRGINDMWTSNPSIAKYLNDAEDGYKYKSGTCKMLDFKCPDCGTVFKQIPQRLFGSYGKITCPCCSDGVSYPEKVVGTLLSTLGIKYIWQFTKNRGGDTWCGKYKYDFYLCDYNIIIEVHGMQHFEDGFFNYSLSDIQTNDSLKKEIALQNGISDYIIIDARMSDFDWIKEQIYNSRLNTILNLDSVDIDKWKNLSLKTNLILIAQDWNDGLSFREIVNKHQIDRHTVRSHLLKCENLGLLNKSYTETTRKFKRAVQCVETGQVFETIKDAQIFCNPNVNSNGSRIAIVLDSSDKTAYGYHWKNYR